MDKVINTYKKDGVDYGAPFIWTPALMQAAGWNTNIDGPLKFSVEGEPYLLVGYGTIGGANIGVGKSLDGNYEAITLPLPEVTVTASPGKSLKTSSGDYANTSDDYYKWRVGTLFANSVNKGIGGTVLLSASPMLGINALPAEIGGTSYTINPYIYDFLKLSLFGYLGDIASKKITGKTFGEFGLLEFSPFFEKIGFGNASQQAGAMTGEMMNPFVLMYGAPMSKVGAPMSEVGAPMSEVGAPMSKVLDIGLKFRDRSFLWAPNSITESIDNTIVKPSPFLYGGLYATGKLDDYYNSVETKGKDVPFLLRSFTKTMLPILSYTLGVGSAGLTSSYNRTKLHLPQLMQDILFHPTETATSAMRGLYATKRNFANMMNKRLFLIENAVKDQMETSQKQLAGGFGFNPAKINVMLYPNKQMFISKYGKGAVANALPDGYTTNYYFTKGNNSGIIEYNDKLAGGLAHHEGLHSARMLYDLLNSYPFGISYDEMPLTKYNFSKKYFELNPSILKDMKLPYDIREGFEALKKVKSNWGLSPDEFASEYADYASRKGFGLKLYDELTDKLRKQFLRAASLRFRGVSNKDIDKIMLAITKFNKTHKYHNKIYSK